MMSRRVDVRSRAAKARERKVRGQLREVIKARGEMPKRKELLENGEWPDPSDFVEFGGYEKVAVEILEELREAGEVITMQEDQAGRLKTKEDFLNWVREIYVEMPSFFEVKRNYSEYYYQILKLFGQWTTFENEFKQYFERSAEEVADEGGTKIGADDTGTKFDAKRIDNANKGVGINVYHVMPPSTGWYEEFKLMKKQCLQQLIDMQKYYKLSQNEFPTRQQINAYAKEYQAALSYPFFDTFLGRQSSWAEQLMRYCVVELGMSFYEGFDEK